MSFAEIAKNASDEFLAWIVDEYPETLAYINLNIFIDVIKKEYVEFCKRIAASGFDVNLQNSDGWTPVTAALGRREIIAELLKSDNINFDIYNKGNCSNFVSMISHHPDLLEIVLKSPQIKSSKDLGDAVFYACRYNNTDALTLLFGHPLTDVNFVSRCDGTALMVALNRDKCNMEVAEMILKHPDFDPNVKDRYGRTIFVIVCSKRRIKQARVIAGHPKFDFELRDHQGRTPVELARHMKLNKLVTDLETIANEANLTACRGTAPSIS